MDHPCELCSGTGEMTWMQPVPGPDGMTMTEMSHPCVNGCSGWYRMPAAETGLVVDEEGRPAGNVAQANTDHRTDWSRPEH
ncbi:hypothetical protein BBK82_30085 [Lentzea guizhouensis]|uniref:Uncharacterized protein n=1 Tax=Lentzea guizhouensis TaxID=1586287 RepID=A0A1B2HPJ3_9PSEU|nr:hypothetical protein [Lentzea guizhouensis]ANZ39662.1 hypothetical protein BBK82_30085 [Lentzea guizhouensis]